MGLDGVTTTFSWDCDLTSSLVALCTLHVDTELILGVFSDDPLFSVRLEREAEWLSDDCLRSLAGGLVSICAVSSALSGTVSTTIGEGGLAMTCLLGFLGWVDPLLGLEGSFRSVLVGEGVEGESPVRSMVSLKKEEGNLSVKALDCASASCSRVSCTFVQFQFL